MTETVSNSMNTEEVSEADFMDALQRGTIVAMTPMELTLSTQLGYCSLCFSFFLGFKGNGISRVKLIFF